MTSTRHHNTNKHNPRQCPQPWSQGPEGSLDTSSLAGPAPTTAQDQPTPDRNTMRRGPPTRFDPTLEPGASQLEQQVGSYAGVLPCQQPHQVTTCGQRPEVLVM